VNKIQKYFYLAMRQYLPQQAKRGSASRRQHSAMRWIVMIIKHNSVAVAAVLAAVAITSIAVPAFAQTKATAGWDTCYSAALERGSGRHRENSQHDAFMDQCMAGKIPLTAERNPPATRSLDRAFAPASLPKHASRHRAVTRPRAELATQH
jgi:uncharacterized membrane protein